MRFERESRSGGRGPLGACEWGLLTSSLVSNHRATSGGPGAVVFRVDAVAVHFVTCGCDRLAHRFGNATDNPLRERRYPTDMTDAEWTEVRPPLPVPGWMQGRGGQPEA